MTINFEKVCSFSLLLISIPAITPTIAKSVTKSVLYKITELYFPKEIRITTLITPSVKKYVANVFLNFALSAPTPVSYTHLTLPTNREV